MRLPIWFSRRPSSVARPHFLQTALPEQGRSAGLRPRLGRPLEGLHCSGSFFAELVTFDDSCRCFRVGATAFLQHRPGFGRLDQLVSCSLQISLKCGIRMEACDHACGDRLSCLDIALPMHAANRPTLCKIPASIEEQVRTGGSQFDQQESPCPPNGRVAGRIGAFLGQGALFIWRAARLLVRDEGPDTPPVVFSSISGKTSVNHAPSQQQI